MAQILAPNYGLMLASMEVNFMAHLPSGRRETLEPKTLHGTFIATPAMNISAFEAGDRVSPYDKIDMNRVFPGDPGGDYTQQLAYALFRARNNT